MFVLKKLAINYAICFYILNMIFSISIAAFEHNMPMQYILSAFLIVFFAFGGYLNAKKGKSLKSICWLFIFNLIIGIASIYMLEIVGATFNIFGGSKGGEWVLIILFQYATNFYLAPILSLIETNNESFSILFIIICSFIIPFIGFKIGQLSSKKHKYDKFEIY